MNKNQEDTIKYLIEYVSKDESVLGLILCGSIAKGTETDRSDIDVFVVVTEERFKREMSSKNYFWGTNFDSQEFKVEIDGKIIPKDFLQNVWECGNESIKSTLYHSRVIYSRDDDIEKFLMNKCHLSTQQRNENARKFYSLMVSSRFSADDDLDNILYVNKCIYDTVFYACRLVLAHNGIYYPCVKNLYKELNNCDKLPINFIPLMKEVMHSYSFDKMVEFYNCVNNYFVKYHFDNRLRKGYVLENELFWYFNTFPYAEI
ncbi:MAG: nucleotidyltransferase domain-containing protein [Vallitalea sp.]|jgi:hypothetical protein|nr:nucleotidyltransferase domain-containing protein [Vallitalea sp.]